MRIVTWVALALGLASCALEETPYEDCVAAGDGCCSNRECGSDAICDYDYSCQPRLDGGLDCSEPLGDQECHSLCRTDADCPSGQGCIVVQQTQGPEEAKLIGACF